MTGNDSVRAHCLTAPGVGGIAVVQVIGTRAPALVGPCLRSRKNLDLESLTPDQIRLCEFVEEAEVIDDVLVCVRPTESAEWVIDLNFHGGPRILERVLMLLQKRGVQILPRAHDAMHHSCARDFIEFEAMQLLPLIQTRPAAQWMLRVKDSLPAAIQRCEETIALGKFEEAQAHLGEMISTYLAAKKLIHGARIVIIGRPNAGKSTLVNALAQREHILVSDIPGTTRDYVEQPATIEGVPVLLVDTAGIRETPDPLEQEAIRRGHSQLGMADVVLELIDATAHRVESNNFIELLEAGLNSGTNQSPRLRIWTKADRTMHSLIEAEHRGQNEPALQISALNGQGLGDLRLAILRALNLVDWQSRTEVVFSPRQYNLLSKASASLAFPINAGAEALALLKITRLGE